MPTKKRTTRKPRRARKKKGAQVRRIALFTLGFLAILSAGLFGLYYLKSEVTKPAISQAELDRAVSQVDSSLTAAYFDMGISSNDLSSQKTTEKQAGGVSWDYKNIVIEAPRKLSQNEVEKSLEKVVYSVQGLQMKLKESTSSLTAAFSIEDIETHKVKFNFKPEPKPKKVVKKEERKPEKAKDTKDQAAKDQLAKKEEKKDGEKTEKLNEHIEQYKKSAYERPKVVIIVDDIGMNKSPIDKLLSIPAPITYAVLPNLPYSEYAAREANKKGREVMLHLPMEPKESSGYTGTDAGEDALLVGLPKSEIKNRLDRNLSSVPHIQGVNNHMGSKFMENEELLELVMEGVKGKGLFFVDSMTSGASMGTKAASKYGVRSAERDVFLDNSSKSSDYVKSQLRQLVKISKKKGYAIGICHPYPGTVQALSEMVPTLNGEVEFTSVSALLDQSRQIGKNNSN